MATLDLFPARVTFVDSQGRLTPEAYRALNILYQRVGGAIGDLGEDVFGVFASSQEPDYSGAVSNNVQQCVQEQERQYQDITQFQIPDFLFDQMIFQPESNGGNIQTISVSTSPLIYTAPSGGFVSISGGTVTPFTQLTRGSATITLGIVDGIVPVNSGDIVTVTFTAAPTVNFIPR